MAILSDTMYRKLWANDYRRSSQDPRYVTERPERMGTNKQRLSVCGDYKRSKRQGQAEHLQGKRRAIEALERGEDMILYLELGVVLMMLGITVFDLIRAIVWEIEDAIEEWKDINNVE